MASSIASPVRWSGGTPRRSRPTSPSSQPAAVSSWTKGRDRAVNVLARMDPNVAAHRRGREQLFLAAEVEMNDLVTAGSHDGGRQRLGAASARRARHRPADYEWYRTVSAYMDGSAQIIRS